jgi:hypothetical protein
VKPNGWKTTKISCAIDAVQLPRPPFWRLRTVKGSHSKFAGVFFKLVGDYRSVLSLIPILAKLLSEKEAKPLVERL